MSPGNIGELFGCPAGISIDINAIQLELDEENPVSLRLPQKKKQIGLCFYLVYKKDIELQFVPNYE